MRLFYAFVRHTVSHGSIAFVARSHPRSGERAARRRVCARAVSPFDGRHSDGRVAHPAAPALHGQGLAVFGSGVGQRLPSPRWLCRAARWQRSQGTPRSDRDAATTGRFCSSTRKARGSRARRSPHSSRAPRPACCAPACPSCPWRSREPRRSSAATRIGRRASASTVMTVGAPIVPPDARRARCPTAWSTTLTAQLHTRRCKTLLDEARTELHAGPREVVSRRARRGRATRRARDRRRRGLGRGARL